MQPFELNKPINNFLILNIMKKIFVFAAVAAFALSACEKNGGPQVDGSGDSGNATVEGLVMNELDALANIDFETRSREISSSANGWARELYRHAR